MNMPEELVPADSLEFSALPGETAVTEAAGEGDSPGAREAADMRGSY
jgi:hypothetical protein